MSLIHLSAPPSDMNTKAASQRPLANAQVSSTQTGLNVGERILAQVTSVRAASDHLGKAQVLAVNGQVSSATGSTSSPPLQAALQAQMTRTLLDALGRTLSASLEAATQNAKPTTGTQTSSTQNLAGAQGHAPSSAQASHTAQQTATSANQQAPATTKSWMTEFQLANGQKLTLALPKALPVGTQLQVQQTNLQQIQLNQPRIQAPSTQAPSSTSSQTSTPPPQTTPSPQAGQPMREAFAKTPIQNGPSLPAQPIQTKNDQATISIQQIAQPQTAQVQTQLTPTSAPQAPKTLAEALKAVSYHLRNSLPQQKPLLEVRQQLPQLQQNLLQAFRSQMPRTQTSSGSTPNTAQTSTNKASIASTQAQIPTTGKATMSSATTSSTTMSSNLGSTTHSKTPNTQAVMPTPSAPTSAKVSGLPAQIARIEQALTQVHQLLNRIPGSQSSAPQAQEVKTWVQQSGSFMEAQLARQQAPTGDLKAGLLELKHALQQGQQWAGQQAQQGQALNRVQTQALQQIQQWTEAGIARIQSTQVNSLQQTQASVAERGPSVQVVQMELPVIIRQQTETLGLMMETWQDAVDEEGHQGSEQRVRQRYWRMTLSFDLPTLGALHTQVYYHDQKLETEMWFENTQGAAYVQPRLQELEQRLTALGLEVPPVRCRQGCPPQLQTPKHMQNLLDTRA